MRKKLLIRAGFLLLIIGFFAWFAFPFEKRVNLGLDLKGGMHLVLKVDSSKLDADAKQGALERALEVIRNRIDEFGVRETVIQIQGDSQIVLQLPGFTDRERAIDLIKKTGFLEFKLVEDDVNKLKNALSGEINEEYELKYLDEKPIVLNKQSALSGEMIKDARVDFSHEQFGMPYVSLNFTSEGAKEFARLTRENIGRRLAIVLDGNIKSAPVIQEEIPSGNAQISGRFNVQEANDLSVILRVGSLPAPIYIEEERTIGPLLGQDSIKAGITACIVGFILVFVFMSFYYLLPGIIANIALLLNILIIFGTLGFLHVVVPEFAATLTLPGIAGIVLTIGMAVDANVLINERIREELSLGRSLRAAVSNGYDKAFSAIFDSNLTTLIAAGLLFSFGTGPIKGFAVTLSIGLAASMFTAIIVTRTIFDLILLNSKFTRLAMVNFFKKTNIDFFKRRKIFYCISLLLIGIGVFSYVKKGNSIYGVDFAGGQLQEYAFEKDISLSDLRSSLDEIELGDTSIQQIKDNPRHILMRTADDTSSIIQAKFKKDFSDNRLDILRIEKVGPVVGGQLKKKAISALLFALIGILLYVGIRFKHFAFGLAGIIALLHDCLISLGILVMFNRQVDLLIVTALLTIAGYSINDTIVIYDRVREVAKANPKASVRDIVNRAVNQTLSRTIITTILTLLVVVSLLYLGGQILNGFAFCLLIGFISGTYSTIYIVSPLVISWQKRF